MIFKVLDSNTVKTAHMRCDATEINITTINDHDSRLIFL